MSVASIAMLKRKLGRVPTIFWGLAILVFLFTVLSRDFSTARNIMNILQQGSFLIMLCMGVIIVNIMGGIELSVGGVMSLAGMVMAYKIVNMQGSILSGILLALLVGLVCGVLNGIIVDRMKVPSFIGTLGMMYMAASLALVMNDGDVIWGLPKAISAISDFSLFGIPFAVLVTLLTIITSLVILRFTVLGTYFYAIGGNEEALILSGKRSWVYKIMGYAYCGLIAAVAGVVMTTRMQCAQPTVGMGMEFEAFSACVLGGAIAAGKGSVTGALIGALFIVILRNGLNTIGISSFYQLAIIGTAIIMSIVVTVFFERRLEGQK